MTKTELVKSFMAFISIQDVLDSENNLELLNSFFISQKKDVAKWNKLVKSFVSADDDLRKLQGLLKEEFMKLADIEEHMFTKARVR